MFIKKYIILGSTYIIRNAGDGFDVLDVTKEPRIVEEGCGNFKDAIEAIYDDAIGYVPAHYLLEVDV